MIIEISRRLHFWTLILVITSCTAGHEALSGEYRILADFEERLSKFEAHERRVLEELLKKLNHALESGGNGGEAANLKAAGLEILDAAWKKMKLIDPVVKIEGVDHCGSGVIIWKGELTGGLKEYLVLTTLHTLNNILSEPRSEIRKSSSFNVAFKEQNRDRVFQGSLAGKSEELDLGLVVFTAREDFAVASLASKEVFDDVGVLTPIYAVGYPLCEGPIPTRGEISSVNVWMSGKRFYLITANAYFGNSGGGVFSASSNRLIGIFQKIYTHGMARPVAITHMGLVVPLDGILDWLQSSGYGFVVAESASRPASWPAQGKPR